jgi:gamma-glutamyltranspeptidase/glutathione hydrolase
VAKLTKLQRSVERELCVEVTLGCAYGLSVVSRKISRRQMLQTTGVVVGGSLAFPFVARAAEISDDRWGNGAVVGENTGMKAGQKMLADGGNAIDAAVTAALTACIAAPARAGIGGYGGFMVLYSARDKKVTAIDFNTAAPVAARPDMFPVDGKGAVINKANLYGWKAAGVPGILAGLQLALDRYGSRSFREAVQPAIKLANDGFVMGKVFANTLRSGTSRFAKDPGSAKLYLRDGNPLKEGDILRNPDLANMLSTLAGRNSVDSFYRGDIAQRIADAFQKNGGLVTAKDLASYRAREVEPLKLELKNCTVYTPTLTSGGLTTLEALSVLKALKWGAADRSGPAAHARLEALRLAWKDRLEAFADPRNAMVAIDKFLSADYANALSEKVRGAVKARKPLNIHIGEHQDEGTTNISAVDQHGNFVAVTVTHGNSFGAQVTVDGLGLTLGHGMSRFEPNVSHPNAPGPGKRPLINVAPTLITRDSQPIVAVGCAGGMRIPNVIFDFLTEYVLRGTSLKAAIDAPRLQNVGTLYVGVESHWPKNSAQYLKQIGFNVHTGETGAIVSAVERNPTTGKFQAGVRGPAILEMNV